MLYLFHKNLSYSTFVSVVIMSVVHHPHTLIHGDMVVLSPLGSVKFAQYQIKQASIYKKY